MLPEKPVLGYYWHQPDLQINFSWRSYESEISAYNYSQKASRKSLGFEVFKFISDYHGFAAFIGPIISYEWLDVPDVIFTFMKGSFIREEFFEFDFHAPLCRQKVVTANNRYCASNGAIEIFILLQTAHYIHCLIHLLPE